MPTEHIGDSVDPMIAEGGLIVSVNISHNLSHSLGIRLNLSHSLSRILSPLGRPLLRKYQTELFTTMFGLLSQADHQYGDRRPLQNSARAARPNEKFSVQDFAKN